MFRKPKIFYIVLTSITIILNLSHFFIPRNYSNSFDLFEFGYFLTLLWFYVTGIAIIIKAILIFDEKNIIILSMVLFLVGVSLLIFAHVIVNSIYHFSLYV